MQSKKGFTLIELLVVIAIIALLLSIIMPSLSKVKEIAKRVLDANNQRQVGIAVSVYAEGNNSRIVPMTTPTGGTTDPDADNPKEAQPHWGVVAYNDDYRDNGDMKPLHLGVLYDQGEIDNPEVFYCPSQPRTPNYDLPYYYDAYTNNGADQWGTVTVAATTGWSTGDYCRTSYNYWTYDEKKLPDLRGYKAIVLDNVQEWEVVPHRKGSANSDTDPKGLTVLYVDGHVTFCTDSDLWTTETWDGKNCIDEDLGNGPGNDREVFENILKVVEGQ